jgi:hypothetical protein
LSREFSYDRLARFCRPLRADTYRALYNTAIAVDKYKGPKASNFICRRQDYLDLGGCDARFRHHSWQDYQQIYMLEKYQQGKDPLPGEITSGNVTDRCRDEIGRPKALELFQKDDRLCLLHHWHAPGSTPRYLSREGMDANRKILLEYILQSRGAV